MWTIPFAVVALLLTVAVAPITASAQSSLGNFGFTGDAYGTKASVLGGLVVAGPSAFITLGCTDRPHLHKSNATASVSIPGLLSSGTVATTATTSATNKLVSSQTTAATQSLSMLNGAVSVDAITAVSTTTFDSTGFHTSAAGSSLANLVVGGTTFNSTPAPNTKIHLAGLGTVTLNEQKATTSTGAGASLTVNMIHVSITIANPLAAVGTQIIVSHATSDLEGPISGTVDGHAYGSRADLNGVVQSGQTALVVLSCQGTDGQVITNTVASSNLNGLLATGTVTDTAQGTVGPTSNSAETTSTIQAVNILAGLVTVDAVTADAHASSSNGTPTFSDAGSTLGQVTVQGVVLLPIPVPANTQIPLLGLGTLYLHRVIQNPHSIEVRMIELVVTSANSLNLPIGLDVQVAVAEASTH